MAGVLVFLAKGFEEIEALTTADILRRAKIEVYTVSITDERQVLSSHKIPVIADKLIDEIDFDLFDMIVLPGGLPGTTNLEECDKLMQAVDKYYKEGKRLGAICAAPSIFAHRGMLRGIKACCNPAFEAHLVDAGAKLTKDRACTDGIFTTSRAMGTAADFALEILKAFKGDAAAAAMAEDIIK